jgi:uncharacterized protein
VRRFPTRTCVACRTPRQKRELQRVVRTPAGEVMIDPTGKAPGRGAYVCADPACQQTAIAKGALRRALQVPIPAGLFGPVPSAETSPTTSTTDYPEGGA